MRCGRERERVTVLILIVFFQGTLEYLESLAKEHKKADDSDGDDEDDSDEESEFVDETETEVREVDWKCSYNVCLHWCQLWRLNLLNGSVV